MFEDQTFRRAPAHPVAPLNERLAARLMLRARASDADAALAGAAHGLALEAHTGDPAPHVSNEYDTRLAEHLPVLLDPWRLRIDVRPRGPIHAS